MGNVLNMSSFRSCRQREHGRETTLRQFFVEGCACYVLREMVMMVTGPIRTDDNKGRSKRRKIMLVYSVLFFCTTTIQIFHWRDIARHFSIGSTRLATSHVPGIPCLSFVLD